MIPVNKYKTMAKKILTQLIMVLCHLYCRVWYFGRCTLRRKSDFNYFISNVRTQYPTEKMGAFALTNVPFFHKTILVNDIYEKSVSIKIGDITIEYSFDKKLDYTIPLFAYEPKEEVIEAIIHMTRQSHHNASVLSLAKHRKERKADGTKYRKSHS